jgi:hypothetical protein
MWNTSIPAAFVVSIASLRDSAVLKERPDDLSVLGNIAI